MTSSAAIDDGDSPRAALGATKNKTSPKRIRAKDVFTGQLLPDIFLNLNTYCRTLPFSLLFIVAWIDYQKASEKAVIEKKCGSGHSL
jgi:hypothetical protein